MKKMFALLGILAIAATGCRSVVVSGTTMRPHFSMSYYEARLPESLEQVFDATRKGLKDLEIEVEGKRDKLSGQLSGTLADGKKLKVRFSRINPAGTLVKIQIGELVDQSRSAAILEAIKKHL